MMYAASYFLKIMLLAYYLYYHQRTQRICPLTHVNVRYQRLLRVTCFEIQHGVSKVKIVGGDHVCRTQLSTVKLCWILTLFKRGEQALLEWEEVCIHWFIMGFEPEFNVIFQLFGELHKLHNRGKYLLCSWQLQSLFNWINKTALP